MINTEMMILVNSYIQKISHYSQMQVFATSEYQKKYFDMQINEEVIRMVDCIINYSTEPDLHMSGPKVENQQATDQIQKLQMVDQQIENNQTQNQPIDSQQNNRVISKVELSINDGSNNKPAYVAVNGNVYDVTALLPWAGGSHFGLVAGKELTQEFMKCHNEDLEILKKVPILGVLGG